jgi:hypothetical protein
LADPETAF